MWMWFNKEKENHESGEDIKNQVIGAALLQKTKVSRDSLFH